MKQKIIFSSLTLLSIIICKFDCADFVCEDFGISEKSAPGEEDTNSGEDNVCCNSNILQEMRETFDQANKESYQDSFKKLLKSFKILKTEINALEVYINNRTDGKVIHNTLQYAACNAIKEPKSISRLDDRVISNLKNIKCICNHPIVKDLVEERVETVTNIYTEYNDGLFQLRELMTKVKLVGKGNLEDELVDKLLKAIVCKQCSGQRKPICMSECHELINLGMIFEAKKLQLLEGIVKLTQDGLGQVSRISEKLSFEFENVKQSMKESIIAELMEGRDFNQEDCEENNENDITDERSIFADVGASCSTLPSKCNPSNIGSCTLNNCKDQCKVNCCNKSSQNKCTMPTCVGCKGSAAAACIGNTTNQCSGISEKQSKMNVEKITELLYTIQDQIEESNRNLGSNGRYICQQLMETHEHVNLIQDSNEREFGGDFDYILNEKFSEERMQYYSDASQPMNDALDEFNELGAF